jgi:hypothetical protein
LGDRGMQEQAPDIRITSAVRTRDGVIITFSDGSSTLFHPHFLHEVQDHDGNRPLVDKGDNDLTVEPE